MKKLTSLLFTFSLLLFASLVARAATIDVTAANIGKYRTLESRNTYRFTEDVTYNASKTESALMVADGATAVIVVPDGVTVTLKGGNANGKTGAGAGIEVPENAKLYIFGEGTLNAFGGNAASGSAGGAGGAPSISTSGELNSGAGGAGGAGGGGAGAGIGGKGGAGGAGGAAVSGRSSIWHDSLDEDHNYGAGNSGSRGSSGSAGNNGGTVFVAVGAHVTATAGSVGGVGTRGGIPGTGNKVRAASNSNWDHATFCGGGGGGGGGGGAAARARFATSGSRATFTILTAMAVAARRRTRTAMDSRQLGTPIRMTAHRGLGRPRKRARMTAMTGKVPLAAEALPEDRGRGAMRRKSRNLVPRRRSTASPCRSHWVTAGHTIPQTTR